MSVDSGGNAALVLIGHSQDAAQALRAPGCAEAAFSLRAGKDGRRLARRTGADTRLRTRPVR